LNGAVVYVSFAASISGSRPTAACESARWSESADRPLPDLALPQWDVGFSVWHRTLGRIAVLMVAGDVVSASAFAIGKVAVNCVQGPLAPFAPLALALSQDASSVGMVQPIRGLLLGSGLPQASSEAGSPRITDKVSPMRESMPIPHCDNVLFPLVLISVALFQFVGAF